MMEPRHDKAIFKLSFSMCQYDFERFNELLKQMDFYAIRVACHDSVSMTPLYSVLWEIYKNFRSIIFESQRKKYEDKFKQVKTLIGSFSTTNQELKAYGMNQVSTENTILKLLDELQMDLLDIKQIIGLGIMVEKQETSSTKLARALGVPHE
jgi:hypothetical protein